MARHPPHIILAPIGRLLHLPTPELSVTLARAGACLILYNQSYSSSIDRLYVAQVISLQLCCNPMSTHDVLTDWLNATGVIQSHGLHFDDVMSL